MFTKFLRWLNHLTSTATTPPERSLQAQVRELLAQSEVLAAMQMLIDAGYSNVIALKIQQEQALGQYQQKLMDAETFQLTNTRIVYALLDIVEPAENTSTNTQKTTTEESGESLPEHFTEDQCKEIRTHLLRNEYRVALELAKGWSLDGLLLYQRYERATRDLNMGLVRQEDYQRIIQQIIHAATVLVSPEEAQTPLTSVQQQQLRQLMEEGRWPELLALGGEWNDQFLLFSTQYSQIEKAFSQGVITKLSYEDSIKKIQQQVENLIKD